MKKFPLIIAAVAASITLPVVAKPLLNIQRWKTTKGAEVFFVREPQLPMMDLRVVFKAGSSYDGPVYGLSALTNALIGQGAQHATANQIASAFDQVGAQFSTNSGRDMAVVQMRSLTDAKYLTPALQTFTNVMDYATFPTKAVVRVKNQTYAEIKASQQQPGSIARNAFFQLIYHNQPYAHAKIGTQKTVRKITHSQLMHFYKRFYVAKNADVILVGDLTREQAQQIANEVTAQLPEGAAAPAQTEAPQLASNVQKHLDFPAQQTSIVVGQVGINRKNPNYFPLIVGNYVLGGLPLNSILFKELREKRGLTYGAYSTFSPLMLRGPFYITLKTKSSQTPEALKVLKHALTEFIKDGPTVQQLQLAKKNLLGSFPFSVSTNKRILAIVTNMAFYKRPLDFLDQYKEHISSVTTLQVRQAFKAEIDPKRLAVVTVGKA